MKKNKKNLTKILENNISLEVVIIIFFIILITSYRLIISEILSEGGAADFQWYPAKCVFQGINHYSSYLSNDGKCSIFMSQLGEYAQGFYILIFPFTFLEWNIAKVFWTLLNSIFIFLITYLLCRKFKLGKIYTCLLIFFIFSSIITKINLIMGQQTILILFFLILPFIYKSRHSSILSGISYFKYNIGYALFIYFLISKKYKNLFFSIIPCFLGLLIYCFFTNTNPINNLFQPIQLMIKNSEVGSTLNNIFLFSFIKNFSMFNLSVKYLLILIFSILFNIFIIKKISKNYDDLHKLSCLCLLILISTPHWGHDYILLVPLLIYSVKNYQKNLLLFRINFFGAIYFLNLYSGAQIYLNKILLSLKFSEVYIDTISLTFPYFNIFILLFILIFNLKNLKELNPQK
jgi:hypothetical protein